LKQAISFVVVEGKKVRIDRTSVMLVVPASEVASMLMGVSLGEVVGIRIDALVSTLSIGLQF
jgi:hypothetical protein